MNTNIPCLSCLLIWIRRWKISWVSHPRNATILFRWILVLIHHSMYKNIQNKVDSIIVEMGMMRKLCFWCISQQEFHYTLEVFILEAVSLMNFGNTNWVLINKIIQSDREKHIPLEFKSELLLLTLAKASVKFNTG